MVSKHSTIPKLILLLFLSFLLSGMASPPLRIGGLAPSFELENMKGEIIKSSDLKNKIVIVNFWATWCAPCIKEIPELNKAYALLKDKGVAIIAVNFGETRSDVDEFVNKHHFNVPVLLDRYGNTAQEYRVRNLPVTYFISADGLLRASVFGGITQELIEKKIKQIDQANTK